MGKKKNALYSCFVKSGTLIGGTFEGEEEKEEIVTEDMSKALTDEELVKACGGLTAHKGARHGIKWMPSFRECRRPRGSIWKNLRPNRKTRIKVLKLKRRKRKGIGQWTRILSLKIQRN